MFRKKSFSVFPNNIGLLYKENEFQEELKPGVYRFFDRKNVIQIIQIPTIEKFRTVINQEVLTKDNIALRFSYTFFYKITEPKTLVNNIEWQGNYSYLLNQIENYIHEISQIIIRERISVIESEEVNDKRNELFEGLEQELNKKFSGIGIEITKTYLKDVTFPKLIQNLFAKHLEAKIRSKADLENARTQVAAARALKNAASMLKDNDEVKFLQFLETLKEISTKGNNTFVLGDFPGLPVKK